MNPFEKKGDNGLVQRIENWTGKFSIVTTNPSAGELTEQELEDLCDPKPDATGTCLGIVEEIGQNNSLNRGVLIDKMLEGVNSNDMEQTYALRERISRAIDLMIQYKFLKVNPTTGSIDSNVSIVKPA